MKRTLLTIALTTCLSAQAATFNYHGNLQDAGKPADGKYDIELTLYSAADGGKVVAGPLTVHEVNVRDGSFSTEVDFPSIANVPQQAWLGVRVRGAGDGEFAALGARASVGADAVASSVCPGAWTLDGNAGNASGSYLGTADNKPLTFKVNGTLAGSITPGKGVAFGQGTNLSGSAATGQDAFATGELASASGATSFAAGSGVLATGQTSFAIGTAAQVAQAGSYMWGDSNSAASSVAATTGPDQYVVRANGGVVINKGAPVDHGTELSIYPNMTDGDYSNLYLGSREKGGIQLSMNPPTTATSNDASFTVDQFDGTNRARKLFLGSGGAIINDPTSIPTTVSTGNVALSVVHSPTWTPALIDMFGATGDHSYYELSANGGFRIAQYIPGLAYNPRLDIATNGDLTISAAAYKPGGGTWSATSDRRVKQDIAPIDNAVDTLLKLKPVSFRYTPEYRAMEGGLADKPYLGFVAQEFAEVFPDAVTSTGQRVPGASKDAAPILALDPNPALITTVAAVQELAVQSQDDASRVRTLESENAKLHTQLDALSARLSALEHGRKGE